MLGVIAGVAVVSAVTGSAITYRNRRRRIAAEQAAVVAAAKEALKYKGC